MIHIDCAHFVDPCFNTTLGCSTASDCKLNGAAILLRSFRVSKWTLWIESWEEMLPRTSSKILQNVIFMVIFLAISSLSSVVRLKYPKSTVCSTYVWHYSDHLMSQHLYSWWTVSSYFLAALRFKVPHFLTFWLINSRSVAYIIESFVWFICNDSTFFNKLRLRILFCWCFPHLEVFLCRKFEFF
jgi:hypothetical protein